MSIKCLLLGGGGYFGLWGGECRFYFYGHEDFSEENHVGRGGPKKMTKMPSSRYRYEDLISQKLSPALRSGGVLA